ncbi:MAG: hypothetical protein HGA19_06710, partial [Oscillochloris sp.]|nr:hypothetical protein [Oscillochloris sp.]
CTEGELMGRRGKFGRPFFGCSRYPKCDYATNSLEELAPVVHSEPPTKLEPEPTKKPALKPTSSTAKKPAASESKKPAASTPKKPTANETKKPVARKKSA